MPSFLSSQSSYGRPAEAPFVDQPIELEAQAKAAKKKAELSYLQGMQLPDVKYLQHDEKDYQDLQQNTNKLVGELHEEVMKNNGQLSPETKKKAQQIRLVIQNNPQAQTLQQRHDRYKEYVEAVEKNPKLNTFRKRQLIELADRSALTDKTGQFYLPPPVESTQYADKAVDFAKNMSLISDPRKAVEYITRAMPGLPTEQYAMIQSQIYDVRAEDRIKAAVSAYLTASPEIREDVMADTDYNALQEADYLDAISDPNSPYYDPNKAVNYNSEGLRQKHFEDKVTNLASLAALAQKTQKASRSAGIHTDPDATRQAQAAAETQPFTSETGATEGTGSWRDVFGISEPHSGLSGKVPGQDIGVDVTTGIKNPEMDRTKAIQEEAKKITQKAIDLGLVVYKPDGKSLDYPATRKAVEDYGNNIATYSKKTVDVATSAPNVAANLTKSIFGSSNAPSNISNMEFHEQGKPESVTKWSGKEAQENFGNSRVTGLDYTSNKPGALKIAVSDASPIKTDRIYGDTPFVAISRNVALKNAMKPIQELTVQSLEAMKTGQSKDYSKAQKEMADNGFDTFGFGKLVGNSADKTTNQRHLSFLKIENGVPNITVITQLPGGVTITRSLEQVQEQNTSYIFNNILPAMKKGETPAKVEYTEPTQD